MSTQSELIASLPVHLQGFAKIQDYARYTPRDHAVWRYTMRQLVSRLRNTAHPVYIQGLRETGISLEAIPSIEAMNAALASLDWRAVVVDGFIPPAIFMEFQALRILVIALDMRSVEHILYTPAPDIVHESAGHAPFIVDIDYSEFLQRFGEVGMKAISTRQDFAVYSAIRQLSIIKANPASSPAQIDAAQQALTQALAENTRESEATRLARLHWWTVEYGLVGQLEDYRIFGAGLLSSLGESVNCLDDQKVPKQVLTVDAVDVAYDITREQPQLFVTRSCKHLTQVLEEFARSMCFSRGGAQSLRIAIDSESVCTAQYNSGLQVSGRFTQMQTDAVGQLIYLNTTGPTQLAHQDTQLPGHGIEQHPHGFGAPVGKLIDLPQCLSRYSVDELKAAGIELNQACRLEFLSGIVVAGTLTHILRHEHRNLLLSFKSCRVTDRHGQVLFEPDWGSYDMAVGARITSVFGGVADRQRYQLYQQLVTEASPHAEPEPGQAGLMALYAQVRTLRDSPAEPQAVEAIRIAARDYPDEWLLRLELLELLAEGDTGPARALRRELDQVGARNATARQLIGYGLSTLPGAAHPA